MKFLRQKQGAELTMNTVIIAVIVIIVLIVLVLIFTKGAGGFFKGVSSCADRGGSCVSDSQSCTSSRGSVYSLGKCESGVCCIPESSVINTEEQ
jgi:hypothetical protein